MEVEAPRRQRLTRREVICQYKARVTAHKRVNHITVNVEPYFFGFDLGDNIQQSVTFDCWEIDDDNKPTGFRGKDGKFQYDLRSTLPEEDRIRAWRVPFLEHQCYHFAGYTVSHLCHNDRCYNWRHHVFEPLPVNKGRNGCPGGLHCHHRRFVCRRPGPYYNF